MPPQEQKSCSKPLSWKETKKGIRFELGPIETYQLDFQQKIACINGEEFLQDWDVKLEALLITILLDSKRFFKALFVILGFLTILQILEVISLILWLLR